MSAGHHRPVSWQDVLSWLLSVPLWFLLQWQCTDRAKWTMQSRSDSLRVLIERKTTPDTWTMKLYLSVKSGSSSLILRSHCIVLVRCLIGLPITGYFCSRGSSEPSPFSRPYGNVCPMGHFCPEGSGSPRPCPVGSFLSEPGASALSQCHPCPPGKYCLSPGSPQPTGGGFTWYFIN